MRVFLRAGKRRRRGTCQKICLMYRLLLFAAVCCIAPGVLLSCGEAGRESAAYEKDSTQVTFSSADTVVYGLAGAEGTDSVLDLIQPGEDPKHFDIVGARKRGNIIGNFDVGDQVAVVLSVDKKRVVKAIDLSSLVGRWIKESSDSDSVATGFSLGSDGSAGTISRGGTNMFYKKWSIFNANLVLMKQNIFNSKEKPGYDTFDIVRLQEDTLILRQYGQKKPTKYIYKEI